MFKILWWTLTIFGGCVLIGTVMTGFCKWYNTRQNKEKPQFIDPSAIGVLESADCAKQAVQLYKTAVDDKRASVWEFIWKSIKTAADSGHTHADINSGCYTAIPYDMLVGTLKAHGYFPGDINRKPFEQYDYGHYTLRIFWEEEG